VYERDGKMDGHLGLLWRRVAGRLLAAVPPFLAVPEQADHGEKRCNVSAPSLPGIASIQLAALARSSPRIEPRVAPE
jgi:hypothetical protein